MKRFFLIFLAFTVSLSVFSVLLPATDAKAASPFDNTVRLVDKIELKQSASAYCADEDESWDLSANWTDLFNRGMEGNTNDGLHFRYNNGFSQSLYDSYNNAWNNKAYWGVSMSKVNSTQTNMRIWWTEDAEANGFFDGPYGSYTVLNASTQYEPLYFMTVVLDTGYACDASILPGFTVIPGDPEPLGIAYNSGTDVGDYIYFAYLKTITYPSGYAGVTVPSSPAPPGTNYTPSVGFWIDENRQLSALYNGKPDTCLPVGDPTTSCITPKIKYTVFGPDGTTVLDTHTDILYYPYTFQFPGNDTYYFEATFVDPPPPYKSPSPGVILTPSRFTLNVNGVWISGGNALQDCAVVAGVNQCGQPDPLEDCSQYDTIVSILGSPEFPIVSADTLFCNFKNFGRILQNNLIKLFVPSYSFYQNWVTDFQEYLNDKLGFVYASFGLITGIFTGIISGAVATKCSLAPPGTLFGGTFSVNVCSLQTIVGNTAFGVIQGLVIGLTILALAFASYRKYLEVVDNR